MNGQRWNWYGGKNSIHHNLTSFRFFGFLFCEILTANVARFMLQDKCDKTTCKTMIWLNEESVHSLKPLLIPYSIHNAQFKWLGSNASKEICWKFHSRNKNEERSRETKNRKTLQGTRWILLPTTLIRMESLAFDITFSWAFCVDNEGKYI